MKTFEITREQILEVTNWGNSKDREKIKQWFPDAFKPELKVGKWYKVPNSKYIICITDVKKNKAFGFDFEGEYCDENTFGFYNCQEATPQEVETALINEAKKRGLKAYGAYIKSTQGVFGTINGGSYIYSSNKLYYSGFVIFDNGQWAEIIETITKEEAEKLLNKKII